jgi:hypothetical protein
LRQHATLLEVTLVGSAIDPELRIAGDGAQLRLALLNAAEGMIDRCAPEGVVTLGASGNGNRVIVRIEASAVSEPGDAARALSCIVTAPALEHVALLAARRLIEANGGTVALRADVAGTLVFEARLPRAQA